MKFNERKNAMQAIADLKNMSDALGVSPAEFIEMGTTLASLQQTQKDDDNNDEELLNDVYKQLTNIHLYLTLEREEAYVILKDGRPVPFKVTSDDKPEMVLLATDCENLSNTLYEVIAALSKRLGYPVVDAGDDQ